MCFVDGFNLYHAIDELDLNYLKWLDLHKLTQAFIMSSQEKLESVFYFSAYPTWLPNSYRRHQTYVKALESIGVIPIIGHFKEKKRQCAKCGARWCAHEEKQSDVNLAIHFLHQAHTDGFDKAFIVTADSDLCPVIDLVSGTFPEKELHILTPPNRYEIAREIRNKISTNRIKQKHLDASLFPETIYSVEGKFVCKRPVQYGKAM